MAGKTKARLSFHTRILGLVLGTTWLFVGAFAMWQYHREKQFKTMLLDSDLQLYNQLILADMEDGEDIGIAVSRLKMPSDSMRVQLIDSAGRVTFDSYPIPMSGSLNDRQEVQEARRSNRGFIAERTTFDNQVTYFFSATHGPNGLVIRSGVPYDQSLLSNLQADSSFISVLAMVALIISIIGWWGTWQISRSVQRLSRFAQKAERGERIYETSFPRDELGLISSHIVQLYSRLQQVMIERDLQHEELLTAEREKEAFKKRLTTDINHELKTPVASIVLCLETMRDFPSLPEKQKAELNRRMMNNALRLQNMLKDVSLITRMDEGSQMISLSPISLRDVVEEVVSDLTPAAVRSEIEIIMDMPEGDDLIINGNEPLLESIFRNLINNAIQYSGGTQITVKTDGKGNWSIRDNGSGIPEEHHPHIFDRFYRLDVGRSSKAGGTGLGLAIVASAVQIHGGKISIALGRPGTIFSFTLPPEREDDDILM